jgi:guanosine-3',5'-bis(diphosphate) 3'-pyrophosphohydrolase
MDPLLTDLLSAIQQTPRPVDAQKVTAAWEFANQVHQNQKRLSGEPFITHPTQVAKTLALWNLDTTTVIAGLLHDTIEDADVTKESLAKDFGEEVALIVDGVSKITSIRLKGSSEQEFVENFRKMLLVMAKDLRVILVKLADRLHNTQTLNYLSPEKQYSNARETLEIYAPLAERLGMGEIKGALEDLSFPYVYPEEYTALKKQLKPIVSAGEEYIDQIKKELLTLIRPAIPDAVISSRQKHLYSLFQKLQRPEVAGDISKIYDLFAARVIVNTPAECYEALGLIHSQYHPVPYLGVSDFIATPKPNGYQSLHTKVFGPDGHIIELQIRTHAMHEQAEMGIAAHWFYNQAKTSGLSDQKLQQGIAIPTSKLDWVRQLATLQQEIQDNDEYLKTLKFDALQHRLLVFSPKGDVYDLPAGATPVDFAYAVHTDLGSQACGAKVNGKMVQLDHRLNNGDVVEILVDRKRKNPNPDWLNFIVTITARREISKIIKL